MKKLRRILATVTVFAMVFTLFATNTAFAKTTYINADVNYNDGMYVFDANAADLNADVVTVIVDFRVDSRAAQGFYLRFIAGNTTPVGGIRFNQNGLILTENKVQSWGANWLEKYEAFDNDYAMASFSKDVTYTLTLQLEREAGTIDYYLNNEWIGQDEGDLSGWNGPWTHITPGGLAEDKPYFVWEVKSVMGTEKNIMSAEIAKADTLNKRIEVSFSEAPIDESLLEKAVMKNVNGGEEVEIQLEETDGTYAVFTYADDIPVNTEYAIILPENIDGKLGGTLENRFLYFTVEGSSIIPQSTYDIETDEKTFKIDIANGNYNDGQTYYVAGTVVDSGEEAHGNALRLDNIISHKGNSSLGKYGEYNWNGPVGAADGDITAYSFDIKALKPDLQVAIRVKSATGGTPLALAFGKTGYILGGFNWFDRWSTNVDDISTNSRKDMYIGDYSTDEWNNFRLEYDKVNKIARIYLNGELKNTVTNTTAYSDLKWASFVIHAEHLSYEVGEPLLLLDNVQTQIVERPLGVSSMRFADANGKIKGAFDTVSRLLEKIDVTFTANVDDTLLDEATTLWYGERQVGFESEFDSQSKCYTIYPDELPGADEKIEVRMEETLTDGKVVVPAYSGYTQAEDAEDFFGVRTLELVDYQGKKAEELEGTLFVKAAVINTTDSDEDVIISGFAHSGTTLGSFDYREYTVGANSMLIITPDTIPVAIDASNGTMAWATVQNGVDGAPICGARVLGETSEGGFLVIQGEAESNHSVSVAVYVPNKTLADIQGEFRDVIVWKTQLTAENNGKYKTAFDIDYEDAVSGMYRVEIAYDGGAETRYMLYTNPSIAQEVFDELLMPAVESGDKESLGDVIFSKHFDLFVDDRYITEEIADRGAEILLDYVRENELTFSNVETVLNKAVAIAALEAEAIENVTGESEIFDLANSSIKDFFEKSFVTEKTGRIIAKRMKDTKYKASSKFDTAFEHFDAELKDAFILAVVENPEEPSSIKSVLKAFGLTGYTAAHYDYISEKSYDSVDALINVLDNYETKGSGNSGGGGGGGFGGGYTISDKFVPKKEEVTDIPANTTDSQKVFNDLNGYEWAEAAINSLFAEGIVNGVAEGRFEPERNITREEFVKLLCEAFDFGTATSAVVFDDVTENEWFAPYISRAVELGIIKGISETEFGTGALISREDMAVIMYRALSVAGKSVLGEGTDFADGHMVSDYAKDSVSALAGAGIINGIGDGIFAPKGYATRAQAAVIIFRCGKGM